MRDFFERYILNNLLLKLIALVCAVLLWSAISREPTVEIAYSVPIEFHQVPPSLEITTAGIPLAQVRLRGPERRLRQIAASEVHPVINLAGTTIGDHTYDLTAFQVHVPYGVDVVQVTPSQVRIAFDRSLTRQLEIQPRVTGKFENGYGILRITSQPPVITVVGPEERVRPANVAITDPIDATGVRGSATFTTNAYVPDPLVREIRPEQIHVTVTTGPLPPGSSGPPAESRTR